QLQTVFNTNQTFPILETSLYKVHQRVANTLYEGRVILMGDAGHINSPMGGLGLNGGIHDAVDICKRIPKILSSNNKNTKQKELQSYSDIRREIAFKYIKSITEKNTKILKEKDPVF